ncbi:MAG TPA: hypothetical protein VMU81_09545 [Acetobacteraceae bacterium]|nr:hypothetical protein [Acetobacteraceae bacterium]
MPATLIATTRQSELEPLGTGGQSAISVAPTLRSALSRMLSPGHAALLAEPVANPARGEIDWYADITGEAVPLPSLPPPARADAGATLARLGAEISALAANLANAPAEADRFLGAMLGAALSVPDESYVRVADGRPFLVGWGHRQAGPRHPNPLVIGTLQASQVRMPILPPPPRFLPVAPLARTAPAWLWWLALAAAVLLWILPVWLLADAFAAPVPCAVAPSGLAQMQRLDEAHAVTAALAARLAALRAAAQAPCPAGAAPAQGHGANP